MTALEIVARYLCVYCGEAPSSDWLPPNSMVLTEPRWRAHIANAKILLEQLAKAEPEAAVTMTDQPTEWQPGDHCVLDGELDYFQDLGFWRGAFPADLVWTIRRVTDDNRVHLHAPGYGLLHGNPTDYGNGGIRLRLDQFQTHARPIQDD